MQPEPANDPQGETNEDADLKRMFQQSTPTFSSVDVDAVLKQASLDLQISGSGISSEPLTAQSSNQLVPISSSVSMSRRRIMMLSKVGAIGVCAASICLALVFSLSGGNTVLGQVQNALKKTQTATYTVTTITGDQPAQTWNVKLHGDTQCRVDQPSGTYLIFDIGGKRIMEVNPGERKVRITLNLPVPNDFNILAQLTNLNASAAKVQPFVPNRQIDGVTATGFVVEENGATYNVWVDPKTNLPLEMEAERKIPVPDGQGGIKQEVVRERCTQFRFDPPLEASLFTFAVPEGFAVETRQAPTSGAAAVDQERRAAEAQKAAQDAALKKAQEDPK